MENLSNYRRRAEAGRNDVNDDAHAEETAGRWLISYSDLITTLMVLFLALYVLELARNKNLEIRAATATAGAHPAPAVDNGVALSPNLEQERARSHLLSLLTVLQDRKQITVKKSSKGIEISIDARILFNSGDARLLPQALGVLEEVASALREQSGDILVEGHTDNVPVKNAKFESNWELSSARAGSVVRFFVEHGVAPRRLAAVGRADNFPLVLGDDAASLAMNRRVTIVVQY
ncbi:OmpA family protein [Paraburkholderia jirisanensis]